MLPQENIRWIRVARLAGCALFLFAGLSTTVAQPDSPEIVAISPSSGPEGARVEITGKNLQHVSAVRFGATPAVFQPSSPQKVIAIVPHKTSTSIITVITTQGQSSGPFAFVTVNDPRIPDEVSYKAGYVNPVPPPPDFSSARLWGIAIADPRVPGHESAQVEIAWSKLTCRVDGREVVLNDDGGQVRGGLYQRQPWFATEAHDPMPLTYDLRNRSVILAVGRRSDRIWHFWSPSPRAPLPAGKLEGCTVRARVRISPGALLQIGMDYWRSPTIAYGLGGNNHEAGASNWYFPSPQWQEATFTDIGGPRF
ncbi:MAG: IPT/TIG domain-containing protein [Terriglobales bacterium]